MWLEKLSMNIQHGAPDDFFYNRSLHSADGKNEGRQFPEK